MIWKTIKQRLADKAIKKQLPNEQFNVVPVNWHVVKNIGLLFQANDQKTLHEMQELIRHWTNEGKQIHVLVYISDARKIRLEKLDYWQRCNKKDFSSTGIPKADDIHQFIEQPFDLLIDLNITGQIQLYSVSVFSKAKFKVGANLPMNKHLPFTIDISKSLETCTISKLGQELSEHLKKIQFV